MQKSTAGPPGLVYYIIGKRNEIVTVIKLLVPDKFSYTSPSSSEAYHLVTFPVCTDSHRTDRRVKPRHITSSGQNRHYPLCFLNVCHYILFFSCCHFLFLKTAKV